MMGKSAWRTVGIMNAPGTIRALRRGLEVLELLQGRTGVSLTELHRLTGLPMATLLRILRTLEEADFVRRGLGDGLYHASTRMQRVGRKIGEDERLIEAGAPVLGELCTKIAWASDIAVFDGLGSGAMKS